MSKELGLSLIELLVAILISTILVLGVTELFGNTSASDRANSALARVQESGRLVLEMIGADARRAGYVGCINNSPIRTTSAVTASAEAPILTKVGALTFPADGIDATATSLTFRYGVPATGGGATPLPVANPTCGGAQLELKEVVYANCNTSIPRICMNGDPILDNAEITEISFGIPTGSDSTRWTDAASATASELETAHLVRIKVTVGESKENIEREFSSTYSLRNRT